MSANDAVRLVIRKVPRIFVLSVDANRNIPAIAKKDRLSDNCRCLSSSFLFVLSSDTPSSDPLLAAALVFVLPAFGQSSSQWQQHVDYEMDLRLNTETHRVDGHQRLTYTNNSPDTLRTVYYYLYFNAFQPTSMMAERNRQLPDPDGRTVPRIFNLAPDEQGWYKIESLVQDGELVPYDVTDTVMRVDLADPILPGESTTFVMNYRSQVPLQTRRSGRNSRGDSIDYTMTQWYPKMAAYDERGWHANLHESRVLRAVRRL